MVVCVSGRCEQFCLIDDDVILAGQMHSHTAIHSLSVAHRRQQLTPSALVCVYVRGSVVGSADWTSKAEQQVQNMVAGITGVRGRVPAQYARIVAAYWPPSSSGNNSSSSARTPPKRAKTTTANAKAAAPAVPTKTSEASDASEPSLSYLVDMIDSAKMSVNVSCTELNTKSVRVASACALECCWRSGDVVERSC